MADDSITLTGDAFLLVEMDASGETTRTRAFVSWASTARAAKAVLASGKRAAVFRLEMVQPGTELDLVAEGAV